MRGLGRFSRGMQQRFAGKLPMALVVPFACSLPFIEVLIGALLILGLFNSIALMLSGLLLIALTFGMVILGDTPTGANNLRYVLINFVFIVFGRAEQLLRGSDDAEETAALSIVTAFIIRGQWK